MARPLLLTGFMATGKSTLGQQLAQRLGRRFVDLDASIEAQTGKLISTLFRDHGEGHFRELERQALRLLLDSSDAPVVALGGGALLQREQRLHALERAVVIALHAKPETLAHRIAAAGGSRPLGAHGNPEHLELLLSQRAAGYAEAHARLDTDDTSPQLLVEQAAAIWQRDPIAVAAGVNSYAVDVAIGSSASWLAHMLHSVSHTVLLSDETVAALYGAEVQAQLEGGHRRCSAITIKPGEEHKNPQTLFDIWQRCLAAGADRKSAFVGLGGGVVTDIAGFAAATWMRGVPWFALPTTLLSMVDASVGGKTAVDLGEAKNAVGAFWQPRGVLCDIARLASEPERGFRSALAEVVKTALLGDPALFELLEQQTPAVLARQPEVVMEIVRRCVAVKASVVSRDERESGLRAALNLGHTLGHALEAHGGYGRLTHGEAVSLGLVAALRVGERLQVTPGDLTTRAVNLLEQLGLPTDPQAYGLAQAAKLVSYDKKRAGAELRFVLVSALGQVVFKSLPVAEVQAYAEQLR
jgi:shikimate kinase/3-dehydroquinate synthase